MTTSSNFKINRTKGGHISISVLMPIWNKQLDSGNLLIHLPLLNIETYAQNELDSVEAIKEAIASFCIVSEKFGQGIENELQSIGWKSINSVSGEIDLGYCASDPDSMLERIMQTGENYITQNLEIA